MFKDRRHAGRALARLLKRYADRPDSIVLGLPRGGIPVAFEVARELHLPLDVFLVRKLGVPGQEELAMGAIASGDVRVLNEDTIRMLRIDADTIDRVAAREERELRRREALDRDGRPAPVIRGQTVILIDDGLATGSTMKAAAQALRQQSPARIIVAVPVAAAESCEQFANDVDEVVCAETPSPFHAVGMWYDDFSQTTDRQVQELLQAAAHSIPVATATRDETSRQGGMPWPTML